MAQRSMQKHISPEDYSAGPLPAYRARVARGELVSDPSQALAIERLQDLWAKLRGYDPPPLSAAPRAGLLQRFLRRKPTEGADDLHPDGLYLIGEVGRGKSMLMDLFFAAADVKRKRRLHFHQFMQECHKRIHAWRKANPTESDPIPPLADTIAGCRAILDGETDAWPEQALYMIGALRDAPPAAA